MISLLPGDEVLCYDGAEFKDDITTPCSMLYRPATVLRYYSRLDRKSQPSRGHFENSVKFVARPLT